MEKFKFFWKSYSVFSQWHSTSFEIDGIRFDTAEHYMMYMKAKLFKDDVIANAIVANGAIHPMDVKKLGKQVKNFDSAIWDKHKLKIVYDGNYAKFTQNKDALKKLLQTKGKTLVEASPFDKIWGIGLDHKDPRAQNRKTWRGQNLLGEILTTLRDDLIQDGWESSNG